MGKKIEENKFISEDEEVRDGFLVTSNRKKVWNVQLGLLEEFKRICKEHNLEYYAEGGTLLGAIRHKGFIPWDDDMDLVMFRNDYEKFLKLAESELPKNYKIQIYHMGFIKLVNTETAALTEENMQNKNNISGIWIDIFPIDYASKLKIVNRIKWKILLIIKSIIHLQQLNWDPKKVGMLKKIFVPFLKFIFTKFKLSGYKIHERIAKTTFMKSRSIFNGRNPYLFYQDDIYDKSNEVPFECTVIKIPAGYDKYLSKKYGNYMNPIIFQGGHNCRYSVDKSYRDIIKSFDKSKTDKENCENCQSLFVL